MTHCYTLVLSVDVPALERLRQAGMRIVVARHGADSTSNVAWLAWNPSSPDVLSWDDTYGVFAGAPVLRPGEAVRIIAEVHPALDRAVYPLRSDGFGPPEPSGDIPPRHHDVRNETGQPAAFGLLQTASLNGLSQRFPLNAVVTNDSEVAPDFAPPTHLSMWMQADIESGSVVSIPPSAITIAFNESRRIVHIRIDEQIDTFIEETSVVAAAGPPWKAPPITVEPVRQTAREWCSAACTEMILSTFGYTATIPADMQEDLGRIIDRSSNDQFDFGSPEGVAGALAQYPQDHPNSTPRPNYGVSRTARAIPSCETMVRALLLKRPTAVIVFGGTHWIVVFAAEGTGDPAGGNGFGIDSITILNPADGFVRAIPGGTRRPPPARESFIEEHLPLTAFLDTYFHELNPDRKYSDDRNFVIVTDRSAVPTGVLRAPAQAPSDAQPAVTVDTIAARASNFRRSLLNDPSAGNAPGKPRMVRRLGGAESYWLVPFQRPDGFADMLRLDPRGGYLGSAFGLPYTDLHCDDDAIDIALAAVPIAVDGPKIEPQGKPDLVWHPSRESRSPFNPFYELAAGGWTAYVSLGGRATACLHEDRPGTRIAMQ
ncbi:MAG TPA: hypothetical protein VGD01_10365 [Candidatus Elarobacter sp.]|jgi:hypothetical protein